VSYTVAAIARARERKKNNHNKIMDRSSHCEIGAKNIETAENMITEPRRGGDGIRDWWGAGEPPRTASPSQPVSCDRSTVYRGAETTT